MIYTGDLTNKADRKKFDTQFKKAEFNFKQHKER